MYISGMVELAGRTQDYGDGVTYPAVSDSLNDYADATGQAFLPHSCNEWVIGDRLAVETLIADLQSLLEMM